MKKIVLHIFLLFAVTSALFAQQFTSSVDKATVSQNERFKVYFTFQDGDLNKLSDFKPPSFNGLKVLSGPNESRSMQIINGQVSGSLTYSFIVVAPKLGNVKIESASVSFNGSIMKTKPFTIKVVKGTSTKKQVSKDLGISREELEKNLFIRAIPNKTRAKQGEQITITYKLYTKLNISSPQISKLPTYSGFWSEDLETSQNIQFNIEMYKNERYRAAVLKKVALFPTKSGNLEVTPFELKVPVIIRSKRSNNSIFDDFFNDSFFGRTETIEHLTKSNKLKIKVDPLPKNNVPESFSGAVGKFNFKVTLDKTDVDVNEAITVKARISGVGNISLVSLPEIKFPPGIEKYDPKTSESITRKNVISGRKDIEFVIVPRIPGTKKLDPIEFTYYDIDKQKYVTLKSKAFQINVRQGQGNITQNVTGYSKEDVKLLTEDIRFIKTSSVDFIKREEIANVSAWFILGLILPLVGLFGFLFYQKRHDKLAGNLSLLRFQKAEKNARNALKNALQSQEENNIEGYYNNISEALFGYLKDKLQINPADFTLDRAIEELNRKGINGEIVSKIKQTAEKCEFARFAPSAAGLDNNKVYYESVNEIINQLESHIK